MNGAASSAHGVASMFSAAAGTAPAAAFIGAGGKRSRDDEGAMDEDDDYGGDDPQCGATGDDKIHDSAGGFHSSSFYFRPQLARDVRRRFGPSDENSGAAGNFLGGGNFLTSVQNNRDAFGISGSNNSQNVMGVVSVSGLAAPDAARGKRLRDPEAGAAEDEAQAQDSRAQWNTATNRSLAKKDEQIEQLRVENSAAMQTCEELRASESRLSEENKLLKRAVGILEGRLRETAAQGAQASDRVRALEARQAEAEAVLHQAADYVARLEAELTAARAAMAAAVQRSDRTNNSYGEDDEEDGAGGYFGGYTPDMPPPDVY